MSNWWSILPGHTLPRNVEISGAWSIVKLIFHHCLWDLMRPFAEVCSNDTTASAPEGNGYICDEDVDFRPPLRNSNFNERLLGSMEVVGCVSAREVLSRRSPI